MSVAWQQVHPNGHPDSTRCRFLYRFPNAAVDLTKSPSAVFQKQVLALPTDWIFFSGGVIQVRCPLGLLGCFSQGETAPEAMRGRP